MREIKFRAWHSEQKKMYTAEEMAADQLTLLPTGKFINVHSIPKLSEVSDAMIPLQFTGLKDYNDKPIYEGDIVEYVPNVFDEKDAPPIRYLIEWGRWCFVKRRFVDANPYSFDAIEARSKFKVVGNFYEHSHLLTENAIADQK